MSELQQKIKMLSEKQSLDWGGLLGAAKEKAQPHLTAAAEQVKDKVNTAVLPKAQEAATAAAAPVVETAKKLSPYVNAARGAATPVFPSTSALAGSPAAALIGALIGAGMGGKGNRLSGAIHGGARGFGTSLGAGLGGLSIGSPMGGMLGYAGAPTAGGYAGLAAGGGLGGYGGYHAGAGMAKLITGKDAPWAEKKKDKKPKKDDNEKQSKVYEAGEAVDGLHVKHTKMNHKKCTPGEFGAMVKEAVSPAAVNMSANGDGAPFAGLNEMRRAGNDAYLSSPAGLRWRKSRHRHMSNAAANQLTQAQADMSRNYKTEQAMNQLGGASTLASHVGSAVGAPILGGVASMAGGVYGALGANKAQLDRPAYRENLNKAQEFYKEMFPPNRRSLLSPSVGPAAAAGSMTKTQSARDFGAYVKQSFNISEYLPAAGRGAAVGAGLGALGGLINPGEEDEYDDQGRVVVRKQRSRFGAMLRNALMGAGAGGLAGGVGYAASPENMNALINAGDAQVDAALKSLYGAYAGLRNVRQGAQRKIDEMTLHHAPPPSTAVPTSGGKMRIHPGVRSQQQLQSERNWLPQSARETKNEIDAGPTAPIPEISFPNAG